MTQVGSRPAPRWLIALLVVLALLTFARGAWLVLQRPLLGLANSYDEVRYSSCFDLAPVRPGVPAAQFNPQAPLRLFEFYAGFPDGVCVWSTDMVFTAPVAYGWKVAETFGASRVHSIGKLGALRWLIWCICIAWLTRAWLAHGRTDVAFAMLLCAGIVFFDPANTLLFNTWYAEPAATLGFYLCGAGALLVTHAPRRAYWLIAAIGAALLAGSKMQHVLLPLLLAGACLAAGRRAGRSAAFALLFGGVLGAALSLANAARPASQGMEFANRGNFVLMVLLPNSAHPEATAASIGLAADCAARAGPHGIWALPQPIEQSCPSIVQVSSLRAWTALLAEPAAAARAFADIPHWLLPWVSRELGLVEGQQYARLPASQWSLDSLLGDAVSNAVAVLALPWLVLLIALLMRVGPLARICAALCALTALEVPIVALCGDGHSDFAKHAQLAIDASLASLAIPLAALAARWVAPQAAGNIVKNA